jgi:hypothetical protein
MFPKNNMTRPIYETEQDLSREKFIGENLASFWNVNLHKLPRAYYVDWMVTKENKVKGFAELKCRSHNKGQFPSLILSMHKWIHGKQMAAEVDGSFIVVVQWKDGLFYHKQGWCKVDYALGGRKDRGDSQDMEPVVHIPVNYFKTIK